MSEVVIALDQGSSSSRALALDAKGRVVARAQFPVKTYYPRPGWVEHDPVDLARTLERALDAVLNKLSKKCRVIGLGLASQRSTVVLWDSRTGRPACRAPSWMDGRAAGVVAELSPSLEQQAEVHQKTGLYLTPYYSAPKIRFLLDHEPKARALAEEGRLRIGPVSTYLLWRLSKREVFKVDPSLAQRMMLYNINERTWDESMLSLFNIPRACLPDLVPNGGSWCELRRKGRTIPVYAVMGDQQSAALGQGGQEPGIGVLNYGTGGFFLLNTGEKIHNIPGILTSVAWQKGEGHCSYFLEGTVHAVGNSYKWLKRNFGLMKDVRQVDPACRRSTHRVWALTAIGGLGAPRWDYQTPAAFLGLGDSTNSDDLIRAVTEASAFLISDIIGTIRKSGVDVRELRASGGVAQVDYLLQFQSDLLQQPIARFRESESTALGVASLAAELAGADWGESLRSGVIDTGFSPKQDARSAERLLDSWRRFVSATQDISAKLRELSAPDG